MSFLLSLRRKRANTYMVALVAAISLLGFYLQGFFGRSSLLFDISYLAAIALSILAARRMKSDHLWAMIASSALLAVIVEGTLISAGNSDLSCAKTVLLCRACLGDPDDCLSGYHRSGPNLADGTGHILEAERLRKLAHSS